MSRINFINLRFLAIRRALKKRRVPLARPSRARARTAKPRSKRARRRGRRAPIGASRGFFAREDKKARPPRFEKASLSRGFFRRAGKEKIPGFPPSEVPGFFSRLVSASFASARGFRALIALSAWGKQKRALRVFERRLTVRRRPGRRAKKPLTARFDADRTSRPRAFSSGRDELPRPRRAEGQKTGARKILRALSSFFRAGGQWSDFRPAPLIVSRLSGVLPRRRQYLR